MLAKNLNHFHEYVQNSTVVHVFFEKKIFFDIKYDILKGTISCVLFSKHSKMGKLKSNNKIKIIKNTKFT